ncbi:major facilitator superfamily domain-containing protein [Myxozyma melibiosi]|uniref:Major facilitator superfamily domain-containing protein n=1 Tax=Myxozyma melibiosi TaxID=54550 RepID=A0ABR1F546_9ASCO
MNDISETKTISAAADDAVPEKGITVNNADMAYQFLHEARDAGVEVETIDEKRLRWKIDLRLMPLLMFIYFLQYLDKTLLNYAAVMGIRENLTNAQYSNLGTIFYVGYIVSEPITTYLMQRFPLGKYLGVNVTLWGIVVACHAACRTYAPLMVIRVLLGIFEACVAPALVLITGMWWTKPEQQRRTGLWYMQIGVAQIIGAAISYGFQHVNSTRLDNWQILFLFMGLLTVVVGIATIFLLPDNPMGASFLTRGEKVLAIEHVRENKTGVENKTFKWEQVRELLFKDIYTWPVFFITLLAMIDNGAVSNFSSIIIKTFGYSNERTTIIQMPSGAVSIIATLVATYAASFSGERALFMGLITIPSVLGAGLLLGLADNYKVGRLFGVYLLNFCPAMLPVVYSWSGANTAGYTKRAVRNAIILISFCIGNIIGPQMFKNGDAPAYDPAKIALIVTMSAVVVMSVGLRQLVIWDNKRRDAESRPEEFEMVEDREFMDLTDVQNREFRYSK